MKERKSPSSILANALETIFKRTYAYSFRMIFLSPDWQLEHTTRVRAYDIQCEGAHHINDILKTTIQKRKMEAFINIKNYTNRPYKRSNSTRAKSQGENRKLVRKNSGLNNSIGWSRCKYQTPSKKNELNQLFSKVKFIASSIINQDEDKKSYRNYVNRNSQQSPLELYHKIQKLEDEMMQLVEKKTRVTPSSTASSTFQLKQNPRARNIKIQKFNIYL